MVPSVVRWPQSTTKRKVVLQRLLSKVQEASKEVKFMEERVFFLLSLGQISSATVSVCVEQNTFSGQLVNKTKEKIVIYQFSK